MGDQQCPEGQAVTLAQHLRADEHEQQAQRNTGNNIGVGHGNIGKTHDGFTHFGIESVDANSGHSTKGRSNGRRQHGDQNRVTQQSQQAAVCKHSGILAQGKAFKFRNILAGIKGCHDQHRHRDIQEHEDQNGDCTVYMLHTITDPSSSPPKRLMMPVQTKTKTISSRLSAAPILALSPCLN